MDTIRQASTNTIPGRIIGISGLAGRLLLVWFVFSHAAQGAQPAPPAHAYAIQLESSRKPNLDDYHGILHLGTLYTYRDKKNKELIRVRLGYYAHRKDANRALTQIRKQGFSDAYITKILNPRKLDASIQSTRKTSHPQPAIEQAAPTLAPPVANTAKGEASQPHRYVIQLEASYRPNMADFDSIRRHGELYTKKSAQKGLTHVRLGTYTNFSEAKRILDKIKATGFHDAYIIRTREAPPTPPPKNQIQTHEKPDKPGKPAGSATINVRDNTDAPYLYAIHVTTTENTDMSRYDAIRPYGAVYMSYRYSRNEAERNRIRIMAGYYESQPEAQEALAKVRTAGFPEARIVQVPDRSKTMLNRRNNIRTATRSRQPSARETSAEAGATKHDPFIPPLQPNADPFAGK